MARTIQEIKSEITQKWMADAVIQQVYGFPLAAPFEETFSRVSIESIFFYIVATAIWTLETLFDLHKKEVTDIINELKPHSLRWYVSKAKYFMLGKPLVTDSDYYDTYGMSEEQIEACRIIKYAAAVEKSSVVYLKIATEQSGEPCPVSINELEAFQAYIKEVKDAGVVVQVVNEPAEHFRIQIVIYYDPMVLNNNGQTFAGTYPVKDTIQKFIRELPFNGEYRNVSLVDEIQKIEGVVIPEIQLAETSRDGNAWMAVDAKSNPFPGYYKVYDENDIQITYKPYETVSN